MDSSDDQDEPNKKLVYNSPNRLIKNSMNKLKLDEIVVNLSKTQYDIIETVVEQLKWQVSQSRLSENWDIKWVDNHIQVHDLFKLNDHQKISHFPGITSISRKDQLGRSLMKMNKYFPEDYDFFPMTWSLPADYGDLVRYEQSQIGKKPVYIFKPQASSQGKGIMLTSNIEDFQSKSGIVQVYINNPLLIENLKFDLRIYVLIFGCDPMRIYIYEQGLGRFATQNYQKAKKKNMKQSYIHLTNYAINKGNKKFIKNISQQQMDKGHKRSLTAVYKYLQGKGADVAKIKQKIEDIIVQTILVGKPMMEHAYGLSQANNLANDHCFHILGFDVLLTDKYEPLLLQVNHTPSFSTDTPLDKTIKKNLIKETLELLNVSVERKRSKIRQKEELNQKRALKKTIKLTQEQKSEIKKKIQIEKDQHQGATLKRFKKIYPSSKYDKFQQFATQIFKEHLGFKNKNISSVVNLKKSLNLRPGSLQNFTSAAKIGGKQRKVTLQSQTERLPEITPIKVSKNSIILSSNSKKKNPKVNFYIDRVFHEQQKDSKNKVLYKIKAGNQGAAIKQKGDKYRQGSYVPTKVVQMGAFFPNFNNKNISSNLLPTEEQIKESYTNSYLKRKKKNIEVVPMNFNLNIDTAEEHINSSRNQKKPQSIIQKKIEYQIRSERIKIQKIILDEQYFNRQ